MAWASRRWARRSPLGSMLTTAVDLVLPAECAGCGGHPGPLCGFCVGVLGDFPRWARPRGRGVCLPPCRAAGDYVDPLRSALLAYKERGRRDLAPALGTMLARAVAASLDDAGPEIAETLRLRGEHRPTLGLVPVPSSPAAARARGGDHVRRLARVAGRVLSAAGAPTQVCSVLRLTRPVRDSVGLGAAERAVNLQGAVGVRPRSIDRSLPAVLVMVDDVVTTGTTLSESAGALGRAGMFPVGCAVLAAVLGPIA